VPQADPVDNANGEQLPDGEERAEMFVQEATKYYETLNVSKYINACHSIDALMV
jgi:hypothetical protein